MKSRWKDAMRLYWREYAKESPVLYGEPSAGSEGYSSRIFATASRGVFG